MWRVTLSPPKNPSCRWMDLSLNVQSGSFFSRQPGEAVIKPRFEKVGMEAVVPSQDSSP